MASHNVDIATGHAPLRQSMKKNKLIKVKEHKGNLSIVSVNRNHAECVLVLQHRLTCCAVLGLEVAPRGSRALCDLPQLPCL